MEGWIKTYRALLEWEWHDVPAMMTLWTHLLLLANNKDREWHGTVIRRGQLATSLSNLALMTGLTVKQIRTCLKRLKDSKQIVTKRANNSTIITICKFEVYQPQEQAEGQTNGKQRATEGQQKGTERAAEGQQREKERMKEGKNIKTSTNVDAKKPSFVDPAFEVVFSTWLEYKHQRRESYKSDLSLKSCYNKLVKLAGGDPAVAMMIVVQSMANNWAGLFPLKNEPNNGTAINQPTGDPRQQERANLARDYAATISRRLAEDDARSGALRKP